MELAVTASPRRSSMTSEDVRTVLTEAGEASDDDFPLFEAALACAVHDGAGRPCAPAWAMLDEAVSRLRRRLETQAVDEALAGALAGDLRLAGAVLDYDHLDNTDILSVCERRRGMPVALGLIYLAAARPCEVPLTGVDFPGHFLLRLETDEGPIAVDAFGGGRVILPSELVRLALHAGLPTAAADRLEDLMRPISDRRVLIRLQNNILVRAQAAGDHARAERASLRWAMLDPKDHRPWLDVAAAREAQGRLSGAVEALSRADALGAAGAALARDRIRRRLN